MILCSQKSGKSLDSDNNLKMSLWTINKGIAKTLKIMRREKRIGDFNNLKNIHSNLDIMKIIPNLIKLLGLKKKLHNFSFVASNKSIDRVKTNYFSLETITYIHYL